MKVKLGDVVKAPKFTKKQVKKDKAKNVFRVLQTDEDDDDESGEETLYIRSVECEPSGGGTPGPQTQRPATGDVRGTRSPFIRSDSCKVTGDVPGTRSTFIRPDSCKVTGNVRGTRSPVIGSDSCKVTGHARGTRSPVIGSDSCKVTGHACGTRFPVIGSDACEVTGDALGPRVQYIRSSVDKTPGRTPRVWDQVPAVGVLSKERLPTSKETKGTRMMPYAPRCHEGHCGREEGLEAENEEIREKVSYANAVVQDSEWASLGKGDIIVDSAADESCWPVGQGDAYPTKAASKKMVLRTANGGDMEHYGEKEIIFKYEGGERKDPVGLKFQVTDVRKPLLAVRRLVEKGNKVVLAGGEGESYIKNEATGVKIPIKKKGGSFVIEAHFVMWGF